MRVISTNIGEAKTVLWNGKEVKTGIYKFSVEHAIFLGAEDVENDNVVDRRYHGGVDKACYLYSADNYEYWKKLHPNVKMPWGMFGENLSIEDLHEAEIYVGDIFKIGEAVVQATQPRQPCFKLDIRFETKGMVKQFIDSGFSGVYVRVLEKGNVKRGDLMELIERKNSNSIQKIFELLFTSEFQEEDIQNAINDPFLAESCRKDLQKKWGARDFD
ncbi:MAG: MOSC domain-containing protein [Prolixibacteraceae bacterium]|jgi:MOSC domain-containing protein YiiM|nr:MOSC domain-containing protein [Prolixibacteraceae bacterium]MBT6999566.1 MOSC domain-containing protein [Prolixibacteraceae bacterium]MBT7395350.1 MOSC domain-containing protein [Prolixibacteraceae bacterium]